jgi:hypothetical protein
VACSKEASFTEPLPPMGAIHWVHAVADTGAMDFRPIDIVTNAGLFDAAFRGANQLPQGIEAGTRRIRVFMSSTDPAITGVPIVDTSLAFTAANGYAFIHVGLARTGSIPARGVWVIPENPSTPGAGQIGFRVVHAGAGMALVDVNVTRLASDTLPDAPLVSNLAYAGIGSYLTLPADALATDSMRIVITAAGTKAPVLATVRPPTGAAGTSSVNPIPGARVAGTVMTAVIVPASVVGSQAPQTPAFLAPSAVILVDRRPPNTTPTGP